MTPGRQLVRIEWLDRLEEKLIRIGFCGPVELCQVKSYDDQYTPEDAAQTIP